MELESRGLPLIFLLDDLAPKRVSIGADDTYQNTVSTPRAS